MKTANNAEIIETSLSKGRLYLGGAIFVIGFMSPLLVPLVTALPLSVTSKTAISGLLLVGIPELAMLIAAVVMGKAGFNFLKQWLFSLLKKHLAPPETVSPTRYHIGLFLFSIPLLYGWIVPYIAGYYPIFEEHRIVFAIIGDVIFISSLFVLGGEFWDKLRSLFIYRAKVNLIK